MIWSLIKTFGPYLVILLVGVLIHTHGYNSGYNKANDLRIDQIAKINAAIAEADKRAEEKDLEIANLGKHIQETSNANRQIIESLSEPNINLLNDRVRRETINCQSGNRLSRNSANTASSNGTGITRTGSFLEESGVSLIEAAKQCDTYVESLKACREYLVTVRNLMNNCNKVVIDGNSNNNDK